MTIATTDQPTPSNSDRAVDILRHARDILATPDQWTKGSAARLWDGQPCYPAYEHAITWCALGAVERGHDRDIRLYPAPASAVFYSPYRLALLHLGRALPEPFRADEEGIARYNDHVDTSHQDIVDLLARAVDAAALDKDGDDGDASRGQPAFTK